MSLDDEYVTEGSAGLSSNCPEYLKRLVQLSPGRRLLAIQVRYEGVETRMLKDYDPFLWVEISARQGAVRSEWPSDSAGWRLSRGVLDDVGGGNSLHSSASRSIEVTLPSANEVEA